MLMSIQYMIHFYIYLDGPSKLEIAKFANENGELEDNDIDKCLTCNSYPLF